MFNFFKKKEKFETHKIPRDEIESILEIFDKVKSTQSNKRLRYQMWRKIETFFPDLDFNDNLWTLDVSDILNPVIIKKII